MTTTWKSTPRLVYTLDDAQTFPSLKSNDDRSTGSIATTTSLTASADETIHQLEKQWEIDKDCFTTNLETSIDTKRAAMDTKIEHVMSSLQQTVEQDMKNSMATSEAKITTMVTGLLQVQSGNIVVQVATLLSGAHSSFVTADTLHQAVEQFISSVNTRIDTLTNSPYITTGGSPPRIRKQERIQDSMPYDNLMDTQPPHDDENFNAATPAVDGENH
jgi:hypothetical protein